MPSPTPSGLLIEAQRLVIAAELLREYEGEISLTGYFLFGRSIELSLKAYLLERDVPINILARKFGHDLSKLLDKALEEGLKEMVDLTEQDIAVIHCLNDSYSTKRYEYKETGAMYAYPLENTTVQVTEALAYHLGKRGDLQLPE